MSDDETLFHVLRGNLPWRDATLTECGLKADKNRTISRDELIDRVKKNGQRKTELVACQTCFSTCQRYWEPDAMRRDDREMLWSLQREVSRYSRFGNPQGQLATEMRAIGVLVARHRAEFDELCEDVVAVIPFDAKAKVS